MRHWVIYIILLCCCTSVFSQVTVTTKLAPPPYKSGQPIQMRLEVKHQSGVEIIGVNNSQMATDFDILSDPEFKKIQNGQEIILQKDMVIAPKKYGEMVLATIMAGYNLGGTEKVAFSKYKMINVQDSGGGQPKNTTAISASETVAQMNAQMATMNNKSTAELSQNNPAPNPGNNSAAAIGSDPIANPYGEIKGIKPIIEEPIKFQDFLPYLIAIFLLVVIISVIFHFLNKRNEPEAAPEPEVWVPAHETAIASLATLKSKQLWQNGEVKAYQTELTRIIRKYLENRFEINALEMTSDDIVYHLKKKTSVSDSQQGKVKDILQMADLVKFAKADPPVDINEQFYNDAENFVQTNKTDEIPLSFLQRQPGYQSEAETTTGTAAAVGTTAISAVINTSNVDMLASRIKRLIATLIDSICFALVYTVISAFLFFTIAIEQFSATAAILYYVILVTLIFATYWLFFGYLNANHKQSLGKKLMGIVVTDRTGGPVSLSKSSIRSLIYFLESITMLPLLWILFDKEKQTLHDKAVDSIVINKTYIKESETLDVYV